MGGLVAPIITGFLRSVLRGRMREHGPYLSVLPQSVSDHRPHHSYGPSSGVGPMITGRDYRYDPCS